LKVIKTIQTNKGEIEKKGQKKATKRERKQKSLVQNFLAATESINPFL
jgi:hypothetical protein